MHYGEWRIPKKKQITEWIAVGKELGIGKYEKWAKKISGRQRPINLVGYVGRTKEIQWIKRINLGEGKCIG